MPPTDPPKESTESRPSPAERPDLASPFQLGPFVVRPHELRLVHGDETLALQQKEMALLLALAERASTTDRPMSSAELRLAVWGDQAITDGAAKNLVWQLRNSLGESADAPQWIETVPGAGYRLKIAPSPLPEDEAPPSTVVSSERWTSLLVPLVRHLVELRVASPPPKKK